MNSTDKHILLSKLPKDEQIELIENNKEFFIKKFLDRDEEEKKLSECVKKRTKECGFLEFEIELETHRESNNQYEVNFYFDVPLTKNIIRTIYKLIAKETNNEKIKLLKEKIENFKRLSSVLYQNFGFTVIKENEFYQIYIDCHHIESVMFVEEKAKERIQNIKNNCSNKKLLTLLKKIELGSIYGSGFASKDVDNAIFMFIEDEMEDTKEFAEYFSDQIKQIVDEIDFKAKEILSTANLYNKLMNGKKDIIVDNQNKFIKTISKELSI